MGCWAMPAPLFAVRCLRARYATSVYTQLRVWLLLRSSRSRADSFSKPTSPSALGPHPAMKLTIDDFETKVILGRGGFAWVRLALHIPTGLFMALKCIKKATAVTRNTIADLVDEKRAAVALAATPSPFIVRYYGSFQVRCPRPVACSGMALL